MSYLTAELEAWRAMANRVWHLTTGETREVSPEQLEQRIEEIVVGRRGAWRDEEKTGGQQIMSTKAKSTAKSKQWTTHDPGRVGPAWLKFGERFVPLAKVARLLNRLGASLEGAR